MGGRAFGVYRRLQVAEGVVDDVIDNRSVHQPRGTVQLAIARSWIVPSWSASG